MSKGYMFHEIKRRVLGNVVANMFGQFVTIGVQLVSLPIFLHFWTVAEYGRWVMLIAIPAYMSISDAGVIGFSANRMAMQGAVGNHLMVNKILTSSLYLFKRFSFSFFSIIIFIASILYEYGILSKSEFFVFFILMMVSMGNLYPFFVEAVCRSNNKNALGVYLTNVSRIFEWAGCVTGLFVNGTYVGAAIGMLVGRTIANAASFLLIRKIMPHVKWWGLRADKRLTRLMIKPSLVFCAFPIGGLIGLQGFNLLVGYMVGPVAAAIFSTHRTISRILIQFITVIGHSIWPEISRLYATGNHSSMFLLLRRGLILCVGGCFFASLVLIFLGGDLIRVWSKNQMPFDRELLSLLLLTSVLASFWQPLRMFLMAIGRHFKIGILYLVSNIAILFFVPLYSIFDSLYFFAMLGNCLEAFLVLAVTRMVLDVKKGLKA